MRDLRRSELYRVNLAFAQIALQPFRAIASNSFTEQGGAKRRRPSMHARTVDVHNSRLLLMSRLSAIADTLVFSGRGWDVPRDAREWLPALGRR